MPTSKCLHAFQMTVQAHMSCGDCTCASLAHKEQAKQRRRRTTGNGVVKAEKSRDQL